MFFHELMKWMSTCNNGLCKCWENICHWPLERIKVLFLNNSTTIKAAIITASMQQCQTNEMRRSCFKRRMVISQFAICNFAEKNIHGIHPQLLFHRDQLHSMYCCQCHYLCTLLFAGFAGPKNTAWECSGGVLGNIIEVLGCKNVVLTI